MNIKELRISKNLSQTELGNIVGVERSAICQWEKGGRQPDIQALWKMADYFGVSVDYLIGRISNPYRDILSPAEILTDEERKLINYFRVLNPSMRAYVMQMVKNAVLIKTVENEDKGAKNNEQQNG